MDTSKYIGKQFKNKGRGDGGWDCYGMIKDAYKKEKGIELPNYLNYDSTTDFHKIPLIYYKEREQWEEVDKPTEYDVVVFNVNGFPIHVGLMIDSKRFMHVMKGICVTIESINSIIWKMRVKGFYRYG